MAAITVALASTGSADVTVIDLAAAGDSSSVATAINNNGQVTGEAYFNSGNSQPFLWQNGQLTLLGHNDGATIWGGGINSSGQIVGYGYGSGPPYLQAFLWQSGVVTVLPGSDGLVPLTGNDINDAGQIVGQAMGAVNTEAYVFHDGIVTGLGTLGGGWSNGVAINNAGQAVGYSETPGGGEEPFIWQKGVMTGLGSLGGTHGDATDINDNGIVVGGSHGTDGWDHAFIWQDGRMSAIESLQLGSWASAINNQNQVVGTLYRSDRSYSAFLWQHGGMIDLNTLLPPRSPWHLESALDINDHGQIVGYGLLNGEGHAFLMNIPSPGASMMLGLAASVARTRRRR